MCFFSCERVLSEEVMSLISCSVMGGCEPDIEHRESSDHGAMLSTSAIFLISSEIQFTVSSLLLRTPYLDSASVPPRFLPGTYTTLRSHLMSLSFSLICVG